MPCTEGCTKCENSFECLQCEDGLILNPENLQCEEEPPGKDCVDGLYFDEITEECTECLANCATCQDGNTCDECEPGHVILESYPVQCEPITCPDG